VFPLDRADVRGDHHADSLRFSPHALSSLDPPRADDCRGVCHWSLVGFGPSIIAAALDEHKYRRQTPPRPHVYGTKPRRRRHRSAWVRPTEDPWQAP
jgi:hypothetical protein